MRVATLALLFSLSRARFFALIYECGNLDRHALPEYDELVTSCGANFIKYALAPQETVTNRQTKSDKQTARNSRGPAMRIFKSNGSTKIHQPLEREIGQSIQNLTHTTFRDPENRGDEISANDLGARFLRLTEVSTREIEILIEQLLNLREKLDSDGDRIKDYFARYEGLSQGTFQLTTIISDNVKRLSRAPSSVNETDSPSVVAEAVTPCSEAAPGAPSSVNETDSPSVVAEAASPCPEAVSLSSK